MRALDVKLTSNFNLKLSLMLQMCLVKSFRTPHHPSHYTIVDIRKYEIAWVGSGTRPLPAVVSAEVRSVVIPGKIKRANDLIAHFHTLFSVHCTLTYGSRGIINGGANIPTKMDVRPSNDYSNTENHNCSE